MHHDDARHSRRGIQLWTWALTDLIFIGIMWLTSPPGLGGAVETDARTEPRFQGVADVGPG